MNLDKISAIGATEQVSPPKKLSKKEVTTFNTSLLSFSSNSGGAQQKKPIPKPKCPEAPTKPATPEFAGQRTVWVQKGWTLESLAKNYNVTPEELMELNPFLKSTQDNVVGKKMKIPYRKKDDWENYQKQMEKYNAAVEEYNRKMKIYETALKSYEIIQETKRRNNYDYRDIELSINYETGNIRIKVTGQITLGTIRQDLGIKGGKIKEYNPHIEKNYKPILKMGLRGMKPVMENNWDLITPKNGEIIELPPECIDLENAHRI